MKEQLLHTSFSIVPLSPPFTFLDPIRRYLRSLRQWQVRRTRINRFLLRVLGDRKELLVSESDYYRLLKILGEEHRRGGIHRKQSARLRYLLRRADLYPVRRIPNDMITMNSRFVLSSRRGNRFALSLVYPKDADKSKGKISVVSRLGMSLLGKREGETIADSLRVGVIVYQPESRDDFHL